jgi:hypothetical protein
MLRIWLSTFLEKPQSLKLYGNGNIAGMDQNSPVPIEVHIGCDVIGH